MDEKKQLSTALSDSLNSDITEVVSGLAEIGLDSIMEDGLLRDIPFISTAVSLYRIGQSISERHNIKKLIIFLNSINEKTVDETKRRQYIQTITEDAEKRSKELEYVLVIIDRYIGYEKPTMLAKLYLSYLEEVINWKEFAAYSELIDRFIEGDYETLMSNTESFRTTYNSYNESVFRLVALGLLAETSYPTAIEKSSHGFGMTIQSLERISRGDIQYRRTRQGEKFVAIMNDTMRKG